MTGWLILLGVGLVLSTISGVANMGWFAWYLTTRFDPVWALYWIACLVLQAVQAIGAVLASALLWRRNPLFPAFTTGLLAVRVLSTVVTSAWGDALAGAGFQAMGWGQVGFGFAVACAWVAYLQSSARVKRIFRAKGWRTA